MILVLQIAGGIVLALVLIVTALAIALHKNFIAHSTRTAFERIGEAVYRRRSGIGHVALVAFLAAGFAFFTMMRAEVRRDQVRAWHSSQSYR